MEENSRLQEVADIISSYYGKDKVDLQGNDILVYFPKVTITNENDRSTDITELYVKIQVDNSGRLIGTFTLNRAEYSVIEWYSNYMHSHINSIPKNSLTTFQTPCLGSGPIKNTCLSLNTAFDEDIWNLFTLELDKYVHTESLVGVPYHYLERLGTSSGPSEQEHIVNIEENVSPNFSNYPSYLKEILLNKFMPYLIKSRLFSFNYIEKYNIADSPYNIVIKVSNLFIDWYNNLPSEEQGTIKEDFFNTNSLIKCKIGGGKIVSKVNIDYSNYRAVIGTTLWVFKGKALYLNITDILDNNTTEEDENTSIILAPNIVMALVNKIIKVINYRYGRNESVEPGEEATYI